MMRKAEGPVCLSAALRSVWQQVACLLVLLILQACQVAIAAEENAPAAKQSQPNFLILIADDVDQRDYGCYGNEAIRTPGIDALAKAGLRFTSAFLTTSSCSPTRISILTGKYPHATGAEDLHTPLPPGEVFLSQYLQAAGYFTGHMQKTHYGPLGEEQFEWYSKQTKIAPFLDAAGEKPFFLWVGFSDAHRPYKPGAVNPPHDPATVQVPPYLADTPETRADLALYYDEISRMDGQIGQMVAELKKRGKWENTLTIFLGDNGRPFPGAKGTAYDSGIGTPLIVSWPREIKSDQTCAALTSVIDLAPTILAAAGASIPKHMQGKSILPGLKDPAQPGRKLIFAERNWHNGDEHIRAVRTERYKLIHNAYLELPFSTPSDCSSSPSWDSLLKLKAEGKLTPLQNRIFVAPRPEWELFDLQSDPWEATNLVPEPAQQAIFQELKTALENWQHETGDFPPEKRRRADNVNRVTGVKTSTAIPPLTNLE